MPISNLSVLTRTNEGDLAVVTGSGPIADEVKTSLVRILESAPIVRGTTATMRDLLEPDRGEVVGLSIRTDGKWVWNDSVLYYLREHDVAPPPEFVGYYQLRGFKSHDPTEVELAEVEAFLA